jgi:hypothetical protein
MSNIDSNTGKDKNSVIINAFSMLQALRNDVAELEMVEERYEKEYSSILDSLEEIGIEIAQFRVPSSEIKAHPLSSGASGDRVDPEKKYVDKHYLLAKIDAILGFFDIITSVQPR